MAKWILLHLILFFSFTIESAFAGENFRYFTGIRQMGMGGAAVAVVNDETALLSNPAGLGKLRDPIITIFDPELSGSSNDTGIYGKTQAAGAATTDSSKLLEPQGLLNILKDNPNIHWNSKGQLFPSLVVPNFGFGIFAKQSTDGEVNSTTNNYHYDYFNDFAFVMGYNFKFFDGRIKIGFTAKVMDRTEAHIDALPTATGLRLSDYAKEGGGTGFDGGLILTAPWTWLPTLAATVHDIGNTNFTSGTGFQYQTTTRPDALQQSVDAAFAIFPIIGKHTRMSITGEYTGVTTASQETDLYRRIHAGLEINLSDLLFIRGGMNQRYWTAGMELSTQRFQLQIASYGEEIGTTSATLTTPKEDRRYMGKFSFRF